MSGEGYFWEISENKSGYIRGSGKKALENFRRYHTTRTIKLKKTDGDFVYAHDEFIDDWGSEKMEVVHWLRERLDSGGFVAGAVLQN